VTDTTWSGADRPAERPTDRPTDRPTRVMIVDDQALVRAGFRMVLDAEPDIDVVAECADGQAALDALPGRAVDVVLMDIRMPRLDGIEATRRIVDRGETPKVLVLTTFDLDEYVYAALRAGAAGFLLKDAGPSELLSAIRAVHTGDAVVAPGPTRRLLDRFLPVLSSTGRPSGLERLDVLTEREREVLEAVGRGLNNSEIATALFVAEATVKTHIGRVLAKLGLRDRVQMVVLAYETGLVRIGDG
jgi:DNA-binding NarL/FixJ family response regulator